MYISDNMKMNIFTQSLMHIHAFCVVIADEERIPYRKRCLYWTYEMVSYNQIRLIKFCKNYVRS